MTRAIITRRGAIQLTFAAAALGGTATAAPAADPLKVHTLILFRRKPDQSMGEFMRWYEELHAPGFVSLAKPVVARYARNFVLGYRGADPGFDALVEFGYTSEQNKNDAFKRASAPEAPALLGIGLRTSGEATPPVGNAGARGIGDRFPDNFNMTEMLLAGTPRDQNPTPTFKTMLVLKRKGAEPYKAYADAAMAFGTALAKKLGDDAVRVTLVVYVPPAEGSARVLDGVISVWPKRGVKLPATYQTPASFDVSSVLDVESRESEVGG